MDTMHVHVRDGLLSKDVWCFNYLFTSFSIAVATADDEDEDEDLSDMEGGEEADASSAKQLSKKHQVSINMCSVVRHGHFEVIMLCIFETAIAGNFVHTLSAAPAPVRFRLVVTQLMSKTLR